MENKTHQQKTSPSSVYYCPMECEGEKVYFAPGRCPKCNMFLVPIEQRDDQKNKKIVFSKSNLPENFKDKIGDYFCPMFCEGDKTYSSDSGCPVCHMHLEEITEDLVDNSQLSVDSNSSEKTTDRQAPTDNQNAGKHYCPMHCEGDKVYDFNVGCPVCGMDLVKYPEKKTTQYTCPMHPQIIRDQPGSCPICGMDLVPILTMNNNEDEDETYKILKRKFLIALVFTVPVFILSMGGMWLNLPFSSKISGYLELILTLPILFYARLVSY
ncbi:heavy metal-binding domain-containing protein [Halpernia sp. GG3]